MAKLVKNTKTKQINVKVTKRDELLEKLANLLAEEFEQEVKFTKEGIVLEFENEKGDKKDFVFRVVEKKDRILEVDFIE